MSILIMGMEMPKTCCACFCARDNECGITRYEPTFEEWYEDGVKDCPLVPVPPHGRLIDADVLIDAIIAKYIRHERNRELVFAAAEIKQDLADIINELPTIIPAEEGE